MAENKAEILLGTLLLKTLTAMGPLHGYAIAWRMEQISEQALEINQGAIYASLVRRQQRRWISAVWGSSESNPRRSSTASSRQPLSAEAANGERISGGISRVLPIAERS